MSGRRVHIANTFPEFAEPIREYAHPVHYFHNAYSDLYCYYCFRRSDDDAFAALPLAIFPVCNGPVLDGSRATACLPNIGCHAVFQVGYLFNTADLRLS